MSLTLYMNPDSLDILEREQAHDWNQAVSGMIMRFPFVTPHTILKLVQEDWFGKMSDINYMVCPHGHGVQTVEAFYERDCNAWDFHPEEDLWCRVCGAEMEDVDYADLASV